MNNQNSEMKRVLEICTGDPAGIMAAREGGADRIELCAGLAEGGLTPSAATIRFASSQLPTNVLIRPRSGDFVYSSEELQVMEEDIKIALANGASGIVVGALTPEGKIDVEACRRLILNCRDCDSTFHRAFDVVSDPFEALETIIGLGFKRILTSGQQATALQGAHLIAELHRQAAGRIKIMAGAGVNPDNATELLRLSNADEIHASARSLMPSGMAYGGNASMGSSDNSDGSRLATDKTIVARLRDSIDTVIR